MTKPSTAWSIIIIVNIDFDFKNTTERELSYNEIYQPIIEKQKVIDPCERSVFQLLEQYTEGEKGPKSYRSLAKVHATLLKKKFLLMYLEDIAFCIKRAGWKVTKTFEQARFKRKFILMNQKSRQQSKHDIEKDFYKLMNNSNFGYDCRKNLDNCKFVSIFDELKEVTYINRYYNIFDSKISEFVTSDLLKANVEEKFNNKLIKLVKKDKFYEIKLQTLKT